MVVSQSLIYKVSCELDGPILQSESESMQESNLRPLNSLELYYKSAEVCTATANDSNMR